MTDIELLQSLKLFVEDCTKDLMLPVRKRKTEDLQKERAPEVHLQRLPSKDAQMRRMPYIVLQLVTGKDDETPAEGVQSISKVRIIVATYEEDGSKGSMDLLNVLTRIRIALLKKCEVGQQFLLQKPLERIVYQEDTPPYHLGELLSVWEMPEINREVMKDVFDKF